MKRASIMTAAEVAALADMALADLRKQWERRYGAAPTHRSAEMLRRVLAWRIQADALGGFDAPTRRLLQANRGVAPVPGAGTRLAREWAGKRHEVIVMPDGVSYDGRRYRSLSEVARHITGQRWNGPRFFGLRQENLR